MEQKIAFIINPVSGTSRKKIILDYLHETLDNDPSLKVSYFITQSAEEPFLLADRLKNEKYDVVVAVGGDGTVNQVAQALLGSDTKLGIIPVGSGNGLARYLKIPMSYKKALENILNGFSREIDAGMLNNQVFFCTAGLGFEARVGEEFNKSKARGLISYMYSCVNIYNNYRRETYNIDIDGNKFSVKAFLITFANCSQWGNNAFIAPSASIVDGMLDVVVWKRAPLLMMPLLTTELFLKTINNSEYIDTYRCKRIVVQRETDGLIQYDGESATDEKEVVVSVIPHAVKIIVPEISNFA